MILNRLNAIISIKLSLIPRKKLNKWYKQIVSWVGNMKHTKKHFQSRVGEKSFCITVIIISELTVPGKLPQRYERTVEKKKRKEKEEGKKKGRGKKCIQSRCYPAGKTSGTLTSAVNRVISHSTSSFRRQVIGTPPCFSAI